MIPALFRRVGEPKLIFICYSTPSLASFLQTGSISWLYYADRLLEFPLGLFW